MDDFLIDSIQINAEEISNELRIRPEIYKRLVASFTNSLGEKIKKLNDALSIDDRDQARMILHEIKGTAGNLRLRTIAAPESMLHDAVKIGETQGKLTLYFDVLKTEVEKLQKYVTANFAKSSVE